MLVPILFCVGDSQNNMRVVFMGIRATFFKKIALRLNARDSWTKTQPLSFFISIRNAFDKLKEMRK